MDPSIPTSFIPKRPVTTEPVSVGSPSHSRTVGLLSLVTVVVVIATLLSFVGVYLYGQRLASKKTTLQDSINTARDGLGTDFVTDMKRLSARIDGVKGLIAQHIVISPIFDALQDTTLRSVQYKEFTYEIGVDPSTKAQVVTVDLTGTAKSYATIALQSDAFTQSTLIKNPVFSDLTVDDQGHVNFKLTFTVALSDLSYQKFIDSKTGATATTGTTPAATQTPPPAATQTTTPAAAGATTPVSGANPLTP